MISEDNAEYRELFEILKTGDIDLVFTRLNALPHQDLDTDFLTKVTALQAFYRLLKEREVLGILSHKEVMVAYKSVTHELTELILQQRTDIQDRPVPVIPMEDESFDTQIARHLSNSNIESALNVLIYWAAKSYNRIDRQTLGGIVELKAVFAEYATRKSKSGEQEHKTESYFMKRIMDFTGGLSNSTVSSDVTNQTVQKASSEDKNYNTQIIRYLSNNNIESAFKVLTFWATKSESQIDAKTIIEINELKAEILEYATKKYKYQEIDHKAEAYFIKKIMNITRSLPKFIPDSIAELLYQLRLLSSSMEVLRTEIDKTPPKLILGKENATKKLVGNLSRNINYYFPVLPFVIASVALLVAIYLLVDYSLFLAGIYPEGTLEGKYILYLPLVTFLSLLSILAIQETRLFKYIRLSRTYKRAMLVLNQGYRMTESYRQYK